MKHLSCISHVRILNGEKIKILIELLSLRNTHHIAVYAMPHCHIASLPTRGRGIFYIIMQRFCRNRSYSGSATHSNSQWKKENRAELTPFRAQFAHFHRIFHSVRFVPKDSFSRMHARTVCSPLAHTFTSELATVKMQMNFSPLRREETLPSTERRSRKVFARISNEMSDSQLSPSHCDSSQMFGISTAVDGVGL